MRRFKNFHEGEARLQAESGIDTAEYDRGVDQPFQPELNSSEVKFVNKRTFSVAASLDEAGQPWVSPLVGSAGELFVVEDPTTVHIRPRPVEGDPLLSNIGANAELGVLYFNSAIRRRAKSLGHGVVEADGSITYRMHRMFGLCPKYIFKRSHEPSEGGVASGVDAPASADRLSERDHRQLSAADTIFLASHSQHGADATHRGGPPGFVTVVDDSTLSMPDYVGNGMFQTLGNLMLDDRIGLLSIDFTAGTLIQVAGRGRIEAVEPAGVRTQRALVIDIDQVKTHTADVGRWTDIEPYSIAG